MSGHTPQDGAGDPSMEDILASIRRILNDGEGDPAAPSHEPAAPPDRQSNSSVPSDDVFLLDQTMLIEDPVPMPPSTQDEYHETYQQPAPHQQAPYEPAAPHHQDPPVHEAAAPAPDYSQLDAGDPPPPPEPLLGAAAAAATSASLGALVRVVNQRQTPVYRGGPTLEDMVREELKPMVKSWLDENLAPLVERLVRAEIDRVSKGSA